MSYEITTSHSPVERLLVKTKDHDNKRTIAAFERNNDTDFTYTNGATLKSRKYVRLEFIIEYLTGAFQHCKVTITNRFTMDSKSVEINYNASSGNFQTVDIPDTSYSKIFYSWSTTSISPCGVAINKHNTVEVVLSLYDFMFGDVCVQFYDGSSKDTYMGPLIVQTTLAPSIHSQLVYKWHPHNSVREADYDNVFHDEFGAYWDYSDPTKPNGEQGVSDIGRTDVLLAGQSNNEYYNDFLSDNRLISNGIRDWESTPMSLSGHPTYVVQYYAFVPNELALSNVFKDPTAVDGIGFAPVTRNDNINACYLTTSANYSTSAELNDVFNIRILKVQDTPNHDLVVAVDNNVNKTVQGHYQRFQAYLGCIVSSHNDTTSDIPDMGINGTHFKNRPEDSWFRNHTMLHADFELTGVDPYWIGTEQDP